MIVLYESIEFVACFIEMIIAYKVLYAILHNTRRIDNKYIDILLAVIGAFVIWGCNHIALFSYFTMFLFVFIVSLSSLFLYKVNYLNIFAIVSFYFLLLCYFDLLVLTVLANFFGGYDALINLMSVMGPVRVFMVSIIKVLWIVVYILMKRYLYEISTYIKGKYVLLITSMIGFVGFVYLMEKTLKNFSSTIVWVWFFLVCILALFIFFGYLFIKNKEEKMKSHFLEMRNRLLEENYKSLNDIYASNSKLYHDLNNHLNVLYQMLDDGASDEAKEYIKGISKPVMKLSRTTWTGVDVIDVIINSKLEKMQEMGIKYDFNVEFPSNTNILPHDMCTILANLLDNSIEAVEQLDYVGDISLIIRRINHFILIKVSNSCINSSESFVNYPETTKEKKEQHGWGLPSVKSAVDKYNGSMKCVFNGNTFTVTIMLFYEAVK